MNIDNEKNRELNLDELSEVTGGLKNNNGTFFTRLFSESDDAQNNNPNGQTGQNTNTSNTTNSRIIIRA